MTKKHFQRMADLVNEIRAGNWSDCNGEPTEERDALLVADFAILVAETYNPRFDRFRFLKACGLDRS